MSVLSLWLTHERQQPFSKPQLVVGTPDHPRFLRTDKEFLMNPSLHASLSIRHFFATLAALLFLAPVVSQAQTNTATGINALWSDTSGTYDTADGYYALYLNTTGSGNIAVGASSLYSNTTGSNNIAVGVFALYSNGSGSYNTASGTYSLANNGVGSFNTANGAYSLFGNSSGWYNTASGYEALYNNTTGTANAASGVYALYANTTGSENTAAGVNALYSNTAGNYNTAAGVNALYANTTGWYNTASGYEALYNTTTGTSNAASGVYALYANTTGSENTAAGVDALYANTTGGYNIALGYGAGRNITTGSNNIAIGNVGLSADTGVIRIGTSGTQRATYMAGISGVIASGGVPVYINQNGQLGTLCSSSLVKNDIKDMGSVSDKLMSLRPVTFRYKDTVEHGPHSLQFGLIAEEVAKVYPDLVQYDKAGKPFTIYYHLLTPMLLNEFQKEHRRNEAQKTEISALKATLQQQSAELASLKQAQQQQVKVLAKLAAYVQTAQSREPLQKAMLAQR
jgi:hypothetical protein